MRQYIDFFGKTLLGYFLAIVAFLMLGTIPVAAQTTKSDSIYYVHRNNGEGVFALPDSLVKSFEQTGGKLNFYLLNDSLISFVGSEVDSVSRAMYGAPRITSFKINNKYNADLDNDVYCVISGDRIYGDMGNMLGKDLRPSFETDREALVYVDTVRQYTRTSRVRFDKEVIYTVTDSTPGVIIDRAFVKAVYESDSLLEIPLTVDMLSTNAPTTTGNTLDKAIDNNPGTFYHCTSSADRGTYEVLPLDSCPFIDIKLNERKKEFAFFYMTRHDTDSRQPLAFNIYVSNDQYSWALVDSFGVEDGIPATGANAEFLSPVMDAGRYVRYIRVECSKSNYKNYLCLAELKLYEPNKVIANPPQDYYQYFTRPIGREYKVNLDFRADKAGVPRIDVDIDGGQRITSKDIWLKAKFTLNGNGMYESVEDSIQIKGRGNSSWHWSKKPYTIKFAEKTKLCGLKKGKRWNLMSNHQDVTEMMNATIFKAGRIVGAPYQPHSIPIELYVNGDYYGCYTLTEHVGIHNNCVDEDDWSVMIELDSYFDETYKFHSAFFGLPVNVKNPDFSEEGCPITLSEVKNDWNEFEDQLRRKKDLTEHLSIDTFAMFMFMNDLCGNTELNHPKSTFLYKPHGTDRFIFGPGWDFDWGFGYQTNGRYFVTYSYKTIGVMSGSGCTFFNAMMSHEDILRQYYFLWKNFVENNGLEELLNWMDDYYAYAKPSYEHSMQNGLSNYSYASYFETFKTWLRNRVDYIYNNLTVFDVPLGIEEEKWLEANDKCEEHNGMIVTVKGGALAIESTVETTLKIYRVDGTVAGEIEVGLGENIYPLAPRGMIIVNGQRIYLKPM
ncbi:MAG: CotH kinase family protein [Bacteroidaceae bacterium]|nr:CotH kinase family protein [Bacteroidaceae bacterium]